MTLRGGGKGNPKTAAPRTSTVPGMSAAHRSALDRLVALDTKEKKKADKRKLTKLIYKILRKEGVKMNKTSSSSSSSDSDSDSSSSSDGERKKKKKKTKKKERKPHESEVTRTESEKDRKITELENCLALEKQEKAAAMGELKGLKEATVETAKSGGTLDEAMVLRIVKENADRHTPPRPKTPVPKRPVKGFFAKCHPKGFVRSAARSREIWDGICGELEKAQKEGIKLAGASVNHAIEDVCHNIAQTLCTTHLELINQDEVEAVVEKYGIKGKARNKDNMVQAIIRALNFADLRQDEEFFGLTSDYKPF